MIRTLPSLPGFIMHAAGTVLLALCGLAATASAQVWLEHGDAPDLPPGQAVVGSGPLPALQGQLTAPNDVDLFRILISNPGQFSALTFSGFDAQLFLFDASGMGVAHNDDVAIGQTQARLTGEFVPVPGEYLLAISAWNRDATNPAGARIWLDVPAEHERPPDGPGQPGPLGGWIGGGTGAGSYSIQFSGAAFLSPGGLSPRVVRGPEWQAAQVGESVQFSVLAQGAPPLNYQWYHAGRLLPGAGGPELVIERAGEPDDGPYYVVVTNPFGSVHSPSADLTVYEDCIPPIAVPGDCYVPDAWKSDPVPWNRDVAPRNKIDDLIDAAPGVRHDIIVDFRECITESHLEFLESVAPASSIQQVFVVITSVAMTNVSRAEMLTIAGHVDVALIEKQIAYFADLDVSLPNIAVTGPTYSPSTVADAYPAINGAGIHVAIVDTGVDDDGPGAVGVTHASLSGTFVAGYNAFTDMEGNPDDDHLHGTHVASIALGRAAGATPRGVAPGAGLIDVKVLDAAGTGTSVGVMRGVQRLIQRQRAWNVHVVNMSLRSGEVSNGVESFSQMCDRAVSQGMILIAAAGNSFPARVANPPARAARVIAVAASNDLSTPIRSDDAIAGFSQDGPAIDNGNSDAYDELKPEVTAPGFAILAAAHNTITGTRILSGTSMAAPHVAGLAALALQARPSLNPESFRAALIDSCERRGAPHAAGTGLFPAGWNNRWGWGLVDGFELIDSLFSGPTDVTYGSQPVRRRWDNRNIGPESPPRCGVANRLFAIIRNAGGARADDVRVHFGVFNFSPSAPPFVHVGTAVIDRLDAGQETTVYVPWTPNCTELSRHQCLQVEIGYPSDTNMLNNVAQRNMNVSRSPVYFESRNYLTAEPATITFVPTFEHPERGWDVRITPETVLLGTGDAPPRIEALPLPPAGTPDGAREDIFIEAIADGGVCLGGVTVRAVMRDCNGNGIDDWFDLRDGTSPDLDEDGVPDECACTATWLRFDPRPINYAEVRCDSAGNLLVRSTGEQEWIGAALALDRLQTIRLNWRVLMAPPDAVELELHAAGSFDGQADRPLGSLRVAKAAAERAFDAVVDLSVDFTPIGSGSQRVIVYNDGEPVIWPGVLGQVGPVGHAARFPDSGEFGHWDQAVDCTLRWLSDVEIEIAGGPTVTGDELRIVAEGQSAPSEFLDRVELKLTGAPRMTLTGARLTPLRTPGDLNCDGVVNFGDIDGFVLALTGRVAYYAVYPDCNYDNADADGDGSVTFEDIDPFVGLLIGG